MELTPEQIAEALKELRARGEIEVSPCLWPVGMRKLTTADFHRFAEHAATWNEADKQVQPYPDLDFLRELDHWWLKCYREGRALIIEKSRRMVVSWRLRLLELYVMGLGRMDTAIVNNDRSDAAKHCWRYQHLYEHIQKHNKDWKLPDLEVHRERGQFQVQEIVFPNMSRAGIINADETSFPGEGYGVVVCEELSRYRHSGEVWAQARIVTQGSAQSKGGFLSAVTNTSGENVEWQEIKSGWKECPLLPNRYKDLQGVEVRELANGTIYMRIAHFADPGKDAAWTEKVMSEIPHKQFRREILMDEAVYDGDPVWPEFEYMEHAPPQFRNGLVAPVPGAKYIGGWDLGNTNNPAFVLLMVTQDQVVACFEMVVHAPQQFRPFCQAVKKKLQAYLPGNWPDVDHQGDPAGSAKNNEGYSAFDIAAEFGFRVKPARTNNIEARIDCVGMILRKFVDQTGEESTWRRAFIISEAGCPVLTNALKGAYCYRSRKNSPNMYAEPMKNSYSHVSDALQYGMLSANGVFAAKRKVTNVWRT